MTLWTWWMTCWTTGWTTGWRAWWPTWWMIWWRDKGVKDEVKQAQRAKSRPEGPPARSLLVFVIFDRNMHFPEIYICIISFHSSILPLPLQYLSYLTEICIFQKFSLTFLFYQFVYFPFTHLFCHYHFNICHI